MHDGKTHDPRQLLRKKQFEASDKARSVALLGTMIRDFDNVIVELDKQIAAEESRTRIKDTEHPAYSSLAKATAKRRQNLLISVAQMKSMLDVAKRELREVTVQLLDLEPIQNDQPPTAPASSTPESISAAG
jgi:flagellar protein FliJ